MGRESERGGQKMNLRKEDEENRTITGLSYKS